MTRLAFNFAALLIVVAAVQGCAGVAGPVGPSASGEAVAVEAPRYRVGDRWVYRVRSGWYTPLLYDETRTVTAVGPDGITVAVALRGEQVNVDRVERWAAAGKVVQGTLFDIETRRFREPLDRYRFPLQSGATWSQWIGNYNELTQREGAINHHVRVGRIERVATPAGTFDAIRMQVIMRLDDEEFWRWPTDCYYTVWYAPEVKATVREMRRADYLEKGGGLSVGRLPAQNAQVELVSFTPGA